VIAWLLITLLGGCAAGTLVCPAAARLAQARQWNRRSWRIGGWTIGAFFGIVGTGVTLMNLHCPPGTSLAPCDNRQMAPSAPTPSAGPRQQFEEEVRKLAAEVNQELVKARNGEPAAAPQQQLEAILAELATLADLANSGTLPPANERHLASAWLVVDSWPNNSALGERIMELQQNYVNVR
jgi:hypothetical protein